MSLYHFTKEDLVGSYNIPQEVYDKINFIMIRLNEKVEVQDSFLNALKVIFSNGTTGKQKIESLESAGVRTETKFREEAITMCNYSDWIESKGIAKGLERGRTEERKSLILSLSKQGVSQKTIALATGLTEAQVDSIIAQQIVRLP